MRERVFIFLAICFCLFLSLGSKPAHASYIPQKMVLGESVASVSATVGSYTLSVSGYIAPYASVVLSSDGVVLRSTVADAQGNFAISQVLIKAGFSHFCLDSVDYKRLGESEACFTFSPATGSISRTNIFLPPTLGVYRTNVNVGDRALAWGFSMPGAQVTIHINNGDTCLTTADKNGYYECQIVIKKAGSYTLKADAVLNGKTSEPPVKGVLIQGLSTVQQAGQVVQNIGNNFINQLLNIPGGLFVWIALAILILIIILIWGLKPEWFPKPSIGNPTVAMHQVFDQLFRDRKLHHAWMKGVGY
ncbi:MAG TPA: hypothetical protein VN711_04145 [Candidatus Saccharimonadales bacterium]|nr:hypothetical protein [Candidatus Saccharimonadales bacterium]